MNQTRPGKNDMLNDIVEENAHAIGQLIELLTHLPNNLYRQSFGQRGRHAIGKHVRHIIDHYSALLSATASPKGLLDYENRDRDQSLETDCRAGANQLSAILHSLRRRFVEHDSAELAMLHTSDEQGQVIATSVDRELVFLASHTIHHMAIIGMLAEQAGVEISDEFGVHPSTLRHLQRQQRPMARSA